MYLIGTVLFVCPGRGESNAVLFETRPEAIVKLLNVAFEAGGRRWPDAAIGSGDLREILANNLHRSSVWECVLRALDDATREIGLLVVVALLGSTCPYRHENLDGFGRL